jgi:hypothetical protein
MFVLTLRTTHVRHGHLQGLTEYEDKNHPGDVPACLRLGDALRPSHLPRHLVGAGVQPYGHQDVKTGDYAQRNEVVDQGLESDVVLGVELLVGDVRERIADHYRLIPAKPVADIRGWQDAAKTSPAKLPQFMIPKRAGTAEFFPQQVRKVGRMLPNRLFRCLAWG